MKLKTLKDIEWEVDNEYASPPTTEKVANISDLKQEAIKRYKYWDNFSKSPPDMNTLINYMQIWGRMAELKELFDLTEEELK